MAGGEPKVRERRKECSCLSRRQFTEHWLPIYTAASPLQISGFQRGQEGVTQSAGARNSRPGSQLARFPGRIRHGRRLEKNWAARGAVTDVIRFPEFWLAGELFGWVELSINENKIKVTKNRQIFHFFSSVVATTELAAYLLPAGDTRCISRVVQTVKFSSMITHRIIDQSTVQRKIIVS
jgi:hypothetical protein